MNPTLILHSVTNLKNGQKKEELNVSTVAQKDQSESSMHGKTKKKIEKNINNNAQQTRKKSIFQFDELQANQPLTPFQRLKRNSIMSNKIDMLALSEGSNESSKSQTSKGNQSAIVPISNSRQKNKNTKKIQRKSILNTIFAPFMNENNFQNELSRKRKVSYQQFTIEDLQVLERAIENNRNDLEKELNEIHQEKSIKRKITIKPKVAQKWEKAKNNLMAISLMRKLFGDIKMYGTSMSALNVSEQMISKCRELLEKSSQDVQQKGRSYLLYKGCRFLFYWNIVQMIVFLYTAFYTPIKIFFSSQYEDINNYVIDKFIDFLLFLDMIIICNTAVIHDNVLVESRKQIFYMYLKHLFFLDLLAIIPFEAISVFTQSIDSHLPIITSYYNDIIKLIKLPRIYHRIKMGMKVLDAWKINTAIFRLIKFIFIVIICIHIMGCFWYFLGVQYTNGQITWVEGYDQQNRNNGGIISHEPEHLYIMSIYWCIATGATVGFGDVHAYNETERLVCIIWMILGAGAYSFTIGSLSFMIIEQDTRQSKLTRNLCIADEFCMEAKLSKDLKNKIKKALQYNAVKCILSEDEKDEFFESIPMHLKFELASNMFHGMMELVPFFQDKPTSFIAELMPLLIPAKMAKGETVYYKGSYPNMIYFITNGRVNFVYGLKSVTFKSFVTGSYFGEIEIIHESSRLFSVRCEENSEFLTLEREQFKFICLKYPQIYEEIKELSQEREILMNNAIEKVQKLGDLDVNDQFWEKPTQSFQDIIDERHVQKDIQIQEEGKQQQNNGSRFSPGKKKFDNQLLGEGGGQNESLLNYRRKSYRIKSLMVFGDQQNKGDLNQIKKLKGNIKIEKYERKENATLTIENVKKLSQNNLSISVFDENNQLQMLQVYEEDKNEERKEDDKNNKAKDEPSKQVQPQTQDSAKKPELLGNLQSLNTDILNHSRRKTTVIISNKNHNQVNQCVERPDNQVYYSERKQSCIIQQYEKDNKINIQHDTPLVKDEQQKQLGNQKSIQRKSKHKKFTQMVNLKTNEELQNKKNRRKSTVIKQAKDDKRDEIGDLQQKNLKIVTPNDSAPLALAFEQQNKQQQQPIEIKVSQFQQQPNYININENEQQNQSNQKHFIHDDNEEVKIENVLDFQLNRGKPNHSHDNQLVIENNQIIQEVSQEKIVKETDQIEYNNESKINILSNNSVKDSNNSSQQQIERFNSDDSKQTINEKFKFVEQGSLPTDKFANQKKSIEKYTPSRFSRKNQRNESMKSTQLLEVQTGLKVIDKKLDNLQVKYDVLFDGFVKLNEELNIFLANQTKNETQKQKKLAEKFGLQMHKPIIKLPQQTSSLNEGDEDYYVFERDLQSIQEK